MSSVIMHSADSIKAEAIGKDVAFPIAKQSLSFHAETIPIIRNTPPGRYHLGSNTSENPCMQGQNAAARMRVLTMMRIL